MYILMLLHILHCHLSGPDISLLIIFCIIEYVKNKTLNPWKLYLSYLTYLIITVLYNILSLYLIDFVLKTFWRILDLFCAGEMSKYIFIFSLELQ